MDSKNFKTYKIDLNNFATCTADGQVLYEHIYADSIDKRYTHVSTSREVDLAFEVKHPEFHYVYSCLATPFSTERYLRGIDFTCIDDHYIVVNNKAVFFD